MIKLNIVKARITSGKYLRIILTDNNDKRKICNLIPNMYDYVYYYKLDVYDDENHMYTSTLLAASVKFIGDNNQLIGYEWINSREMHIVFNNSSHKVIIE